MKKVAIFVGFACSVVVYSCKRNLDVQGTGTVYLDVPSVPYKYFPDGTMDAANEKATLGRVLFYDKQLSLNNSVACASCHRQEVAFADVVPRSRGFENRLTGRNSMPIQNLGMSGLFGPLSIASGSGSFFWDGRETDLRNLVARPITNHIEMGIDDVSALPEKLSALPYYPDLFEQAYGTSEITVDRIADAMTFFMTSIQAVNTRFDQAQAGLTDLTALELQGMNLFNTKYNCASCHNLQPQGYTGTEFMNIGLEYPNVDKGLGGIVPSAETMGKFKIPNLRNVALTAPYMHDGRFPALEDVLEHYSHGIQDDPNLDIRLRTADGQPMRMNITDGEKQALVAFLNTLTDHTMISDVKYSNPFKTR